MKSSLFESCGDGNSPRFCYKNCRQVWEQKFALESDAMNRRFSAKTATLHECETENRHKNIEN